MRNFNLRRAFYISVGLHVLWALLILIPKYEKPQVPNVVTVDFISSQDAAKTVAKEDQTKLKQIVDMDQTVNNEKPQKEAFLSAHDQAVKKQTAAPEHGEFRNANSEHSAPSSKAPGHKQAEAKAVQQKPDLRELLGNDPMDMLKRQEARDKQSGEEGERKVTGTEGSRTEDYLKDVDRGKETLLNTREFKYYTYYARIRRQLAQYWESKVHDKLTNMFKQGRRIASEQDHITKLLIVLNDRGVLVRVQVVSESGVADLDEAATEAFREAAPFPNPPKGIVEDDGTVKIRWDFVLES